MDGNRGKSLPHVKSHVAARTDHLGFGIDKRLPHVCRHIGHGDRERSDATYRDKVAPTGVLC